MVHGRGRRNLFRDLDNSFDSKCYYHRTTAQSLVLIEEGGLRWDRMTVTLFSQCDRRRSIVNIIIRVQRLLDLNQVK